MLAVRRVLGNSCNMRRALQSLAIVCAVFVASNSFAADAKVIKTLPEFLDAKGRASLSPSLYERDAYQSYLRHHPHDRAALQLAVQWKASGVDWDKMKLRAELRGVVGNTITNNTLEMPVKKGGPFSTWTNFKVEGDDFKKLGELAAWRVTLWEGDKEIASQQSFLWSGVGESPK